MQQASPLLIDKKEIAKKPIGNILVLSLSGPYNWSLHKTSCMAVDNACLPLFQCGMSSSKCFISTYSS
jgi:hypothetical protein